MEIVFQKFKLEDEIFKLTLSYNGNFLITASKEVVYIWDLRKEKPFLLRFYIMKSEIVKLKFSYDNFRVLVMDKNVNIFNKK